ncbi:MAG TPA: 23S rRNA (guanosine(2251)-2'-O)-methyltransferase RlmB [Candidatus Dormibacteraeota bacterium]|nr:23S rRNA (guanosine(2251)-2'-O)-methyltransferase RlmB [Candidatus Dormibacteraeota bacterium]
MDILYGRNPVLEALRAGRPARKLVLASGVGSEDRLEEILALAHERGIPVEESSRRRLDDVAHTEHHQGIAGYFHGRAPMALEDLLAGARPPQLFVVLDGIQDPQNLGAITRTADAVGADAVVLPKHRAAGVTAAAAKASAGATEHVPVATVTNLVHALERMQAAGLWVVGLAADGGTRYDSFDFTVPVAVVIGAEGEGMRSLTRRHCDAVVALPLAGRVSSLNAAAAAAVLLYEVARQRGFAPRR